MLTMDVNDMRLTRAGRAAGARARLRNPSLTNNSSSNFQLNYRGCLDSNPIPLSGS